MTYLPGQKDTMTTPAEVPPPETPKPRAKRGTTDRYVRNRMAFLCSDGAGSAYDFIVDIEPSFADEVRAAVAVFDRINKTVAALTKAASK